MSINTYAQTWATYQSQLSYMVGLIKEGVLTDQQEDTVADQIEYVQSQVDELESYLIGNYPESFYYNMREIADSMDIEPSDEFMQQLDSHVNGLSLNGIDYQIHAAVDEFNAFYYAATIYMDNGVVLFHGGKLSNERGIRVLFTKQPGYKNITVSDVKNKIKQLEVA